MGIRKLKRDSEVLVVLALSLILCTWLFGPALLAPEGHTVGKPHSEQLVSVWANQLVLDNLARARLPIHAEGVRYHPGGVVYPMSLPTSLLSLPFGLVLDPASTYSAAMVLNFLLALAGAYLLLRHLGGRRKWLALPGALLYALAPFCLDCFALGPIEATALGWIPLALYAVERLDGARPLHHLLRAGALALCFAGNIYYGMFTLGAACYLMLIRDEPRRSTRVRRTLATLAVTALFVAPMVLALTYTFEHPLSLLPLRNLRQDPSFHAQHMTRFQPLDLAAMVLPTRAFNTSHQYLGFYLGLPALLLSGLALVRAPGSRRWLWLALCLMVIVLAAGLRVAGWQLGGDETPWHVPMYWLCMNLPLLAGMFLPHRVLPLLLLCVGAMITLLLAGGQGRPRWMHPLLIGAVIAADMLLVFRGAEPLPTVSFKVPAFYQALAQVPALHGVFDLPIPGLDNEKGRLLLYQRHHGRRIPYTLEMIPFWQLRMDKDIQRYWSAFRLIHKEPLHERDWDEEARRFKCTVACPGLHKIWAQGYGYLVLHRTGHPDLDPKLAACLERCPVALHYTDDEVRVYRAP